MQGAAERFTRIDLQDNNEIVNNVIVLDENEDQSFQIDAKKPGQTHDPDKQFAPRTKRIILFVLGLLVGLMLSVITAKLIGGGKFVPKDTYEYYQELDKNYGKYNEILKMIGEDPIATTPPGEIDDAKLKELVAGIGDPYAEYFTAEEYKEFEKMYSSDYVGIGIAIMDEDDKVVIDRRGQQDYR